jgi:PKD repeat protein
MPPVPIVKTPLPVIADQVAPLPVPPGFNVSISARPPIPIVPYFNVVTPVSQIAPPQSILEGSGRMAPLEVGLGVITSATPSRGSQIPITVAFTAQGVGGTAPYTYSWNFGDGGTSTQQNPSHTYITFQPSFAVSVTVTDNAGNTVVGNLTVTIVPAPPPLVYAVQVAPSFVPEDGKVAPGPTGFWNGYFPTPFEPPPPAPVMAVQVTPPPDLFPDEGAGFAKFAADRGSGSSIVNLALMARLGFLLSPSNGYFVFLPTDLCCPIDLNGQLLLYMKFINGAPDNVVYWQCAMNAGHYGQLGWDTNTSSPKLITGEWPVGPTNVPPADNVPDQPLSNIPGNFDFNFDVDIPTGISSANNLTPDDIKQANADPQAPPIKKIGGSW